MGIWKIHSDNILGFYRNFSRSVIDRNIVFSMFKIEGGTIFCGSLFCLVILTIFYNNFGTDNIITEIHAVVSYQQMHC